MDIEGLIPNYAPQGEKTLIPTWKYPKHKC